MPIALRSDGGGLDRGSDRNAVERTVSSLQDNDQVRKAISPLSAAGEAQLSRNGRIGFISLSLIPSPSELSEDEAESVIAAADPVRKAGIEVSAGGYLGQKVSKPSTETSERIGIAAAIIILLLALGTVVAMAMPIAVAVVGVATGLSVIGLLGHIVDVPSVAATLGTMIGLGVGIDYSLFFVTRYRRRLADGLEPEEAIGRAAATSGSAVAFAGGTVVIALAGAPATVPPALHRVLSTCEAALVLRATCGRTPQAPGHRPVGFARGIRPGLGSTCTRRRR